MTGPNPEHMAMLLKAVRDQRLSGNSGEGRRIIDAVIEGNETDGHYPRFAGGRFDWFDLGWDQPEGKQ